MTHTSDFDPDEHSDLDPDEHAQSSQLAAVPHASQKIQKASALQSETVFREVHARFMLDLHMLCFMFVVACTISYALSGASDGKTLATLGIIGLSTLIFYWQRGDLARAAWADAIMWCIAPSVHMAARVAELSGHGDYASFSSQSATTITQNPTTVVAARIVIGYYYGTLHTLPIRARILNIVAQEVVFVLPALWVFVRSGESAWLEAVGVYVLLPVVAGAIIALLQELVITKLLMRLAQAFTDTLATAMAAQAKEQDQAWTQQYSEHQKLLRGILGYLSKVEQELLLERAQRPRATPACEALADGQQPVSCRPILNMREESSATAAPCAALTQQG